MAAEASVTRGKAPATGTYWRRGNRLLEFEAIHTREDENGDPEAIYRLRDCGKADEVIELTREEFEQLEVITPLTDEEMADGHNQV